MGAPAAAAAGSKAGSAAAIQAAASAAAPAIGSVFGLIGAKRRMKLQNQYNQELARYQNDLNLAQWERENEYNLPVNQMARLREAGINPRMAFGDSASSTATNSPNLVAGSMQAPTNLGETMQTAFSQFGSVVNQMNQIRMIESELEKNKRQSDMFESMTRVNEANAKLKQIESMIKDIDFHYRDFGHQQSIKFKQWAMNNMIANYYDKFGANNIGFSASPVGALPTAYRFDDGREPISLLNRRLMASSIALNDANTRNRNFGVVFMKRRIQSMNLLDEVQRNLARLTYHRGTNEMDKYNTQVLQRSMMGLQKSLLNMQIENMRLHNMDFIPFVGNVSDYTGALVGKFGKSTYFRPFYVY